MEDITRLDKQQVLEKKNHLVAHITNPKQVARGG